MASRAESLLRRENTETLLTAHIRNFIADKKITGRSERTTHWYEWILNQFADDL